MSTDQRQGRHITDWERDKLREKVTDYYLVRRMPIRRIAGRIGRSYGFVHRLLGEAGVELRPKGGRSTGQ